MAGRPYGSKNDRPITDALMLELKKTAEGIDGKPNPAAAKKLRVLANKLVRIALHGEPDIALRAMREILDRVEGKPKQVIAGDPDKPHELVIRVIDPTRGITLENDE